VEDGAILAGKVSRPGHETELGGREELTRGGCVLGVEPNKVEERSLGGGIGLPGGGSESVEEEKCDLSRQVSVRRIPLVRDRGVEDVRQSCGANWNSRLYWKREAVSASAFSDVAIQTAEKVKWRAEESRIICLNTLMPGADRAVSEVSHWTTAWLSHRKTTWVPNHVSPHRKIACRTA
jgi:hypothetical protein